MGLVFRRRRPVARLAVSAATIGVAYWAEKRQAEPDRHDREAAVSYAAGHDPASPPQYVAPPPASTGGEVDELSRLVHMHDSGALTDEEFTAAKAQLLGT